MIYFHLKNSTGWNNPWFHFAFNFRKKCYGICLSSARGLSLVDFLKFSLSLSKHIFDVIQYEESIFYVSKKQTSEIEPALLVRTCNKKTNIYLWNVQHNMELCKNKSTKFTFLLLLYIQISNVIYSTTGAF